MKTPTRKIGKRPARIGKPVNLYLSVDLVRENKQLAKELGVSFSEHINALMLRAIKREADRMRKKMGEAA